MHALLLPVVLRHRRRGNPMRSSRFQGDYSAAQPGTESLGPPTTSEDEPDTIDNDLFNPFIETRSQQRQTRLSATGIPIHSIMLNERNKLDYRLIQRWCALTLEAYVDDHGKPTSVGIQEAHVIPQSFGPKAVCIIFFDIS